MNQTMKSEKLSFWERTAYGTGELGNSIGFQVTGFFLTYFYVDVSGITPAAVAALFLIVRFYSASVFPVAGYIVDHTSSKWGKFRPYFLFGAFPSALLLVLIFAAPGFGFGSRIAWIYAVNILAATIGALLLTSYFSLIAVMTNDTNERTVLTSFRSMIGFGGGLIATIAVKPLVSLFPDEQTGFIMTMVILGAVTVIGYLYTFAVVRERVKPEKKNSYQAKEAITLFLKNSQAVFVSLAYFCVIFSITYKNAATIYYFKVYLSQPQLMTLFLTVTGFPCAIGTIVSPMFNRKYGKRNSCIVGLLLFIICNLVVFLLGPSNIEFIFFFTAIGGIFVIIAIISLDSMLADTVEYGEWKTGRRTEGILASFFNSAGAYAFAFGGALFGLSLSIVGYVANQPTNDTIALGIRSMFTLVPAIVCTIGIIAIFKYQLTHQKYYELVDEIQSRI